MQFDEARRILKFKSTIPEMFCQAGGFHVDKERMGM